MSTPHGSCLPKWHVIYYDLIDFYATSMDISIFASASKFHFISDDFLIVFLKSCVPIETANCYIKFCHPMKYELIEKLFTNFEKKKDVSQINMFSTF